jgi:hypothetical protein
MPAKIRRRGNDHGRRAEAPIEDAAHRAADRRFAELDHGAADGLWLWATSLSPISERRALATASWRDHRRQHDGEGEHEAELGEQRPAMPGKNEIGMKTAASVAVVEMTAKNTWRVPTTAAARGPRPSFAGGRCSR